MSNDSIPFFDVIVLGAGAAGLVAAMDLGRKKKNVLVLEARDRIGGRVHTTRDQNSGNILELGAEFIHGSLPITTSLLKEAGIAKVPVSGEAWQNRNGKLSKGYGFPGDTEFFETQLRELKEDINLHDFLEKFLPGTENIGLRKSITGFAEGYDAADTTRASTFAFRDEWFSEQDWEQYRIEGGYGKLMDYLSSEAEKNKCSICLSKVIREIRWKTGFVEMVSEENEIFAAKKAIITVPVGVLQADDRTRGGIRFKPELPEIRAAAKAMGFGSVIKFILHFKKTFWKTGAVEKYSGQNLDNMGFLFTGGEIPTWWTQLPDESPVLTGWLAGPRAELLKNETQEQLLNKALESLSAVFEVEHKFLKEQLLSQNIINWTNDPFTRGAYVYASVGSISARNILAQAQDNTLYFAGEALYEGPEIGTVEAALASGRVVAKKIDR